MPWSNACAQHGRAAFGEGGYFRFKFGNLCLRGPCRAYIGKPPNEKPPNEKPPNEKPSVGKPSALIWLRWRRSGARGEWVVTATRSSFFAFFNLSHFSSLYQDWNSRPCFVQYIYIYHSRPPFVCLGVGRDPRTKWISRWICFFLIGNNAREYNCT